MLVDLPKEMLAVLHKVRYQDSSMNEMQQILRQVYDQTGGSIVAYVFPSTYKVEDSGLPKKIEINLENYQVAIYDGDTVTRTEISDKPTDTYKCQNKEAAKLLLWGIFNIATLIDPKATFEVFRVFDDKEIQWKSWFEQMSDEKPEKQSPDD